METHNFQNIIAHYHERLFNQWLFITCLLCSGALVTIIIITTTQLISYTEVKKEYLAASQETQTLKNSWITGRKLFKKHKELKKQDALFRMNRCTELLKSISQAIPSSTHLTFLSMDGSLTLKGYALDMHELAVFTSRLSSSGFSEVTIQQSSSMPLGISFEITAKQAYN